MRSCSANTMYMYACHLLAMSWSDDPCRCCWAQKVCYEAGSIEVSGCSSCQARDRWGLPVSDRCAGWIMVAIFRGNWGGGG
ncbi:hypothetical protein EV126DRAFT_405919 [Verticillium dahliae]|nr:hypothetical protein EV126DRAFT_405919 [Verticillium dahliae]